MHAINLHDFSDPKNSVSDKDIDAQITQKILSAIKQHDVKRWNAKIESMMVRKVLPDFVEKFSKLQQTDLYIKKSIERAVKHIKVLCNDRQAVAQDGQVNVVTMIKNCIETTHKNSTIQAYEHAFKEAKTLKSFFVKEREDEKVEEKVAKAIFSMEQYNCVEKGYSPFEKIDSLDELILQQQLALFCSYEPKSYEKICNDVIDSLNQLETISHLSDLPVIIAATHAKNLSNKIDFRKKLGVKNVDLLESFIVQQSKNNNYSSLLDLYNKIHFLLHISSHHEEKGKLAQACKDYIHSLSFNRYQPAFCRLGPKIYPFIQEEIKKIKKNRPLATVDEILNEITHLFSLVEELKIPKNLNKQTVEIFVFSTFFKHLDEIKALSELTFTKISEQLSTVCLAKVNLSFLEVVHTTYEKIARYKSIKMPKNTNLSLFDQDTIQDKITHFAVQNELVIDSLKPSFDHPLYRLAKKYLQPVKPEPISEEVRKIIFEKLFKEYPHLESYIEFYKKELIFYQKSLWYQTNKKQHRTPIERFYLWHYAFIKKENPKLKGKELLLKMDAFTMSSLPLMPSYKLGHL